MVADSVIVQESEVVENDLPVVIQAELSEDEVGEEEAGDEVEQVEVVAKPRNVFHGRKRVGLRINAPL